MNKYDDTIAAIATGYASGGIGIIRISGAKSLAIAVYVSTIRKESFEPYKLVYGYIKDHETGSHIDQVLISYMPGPSSYTGEDIIEINCHGGRVILQKVLELVIRQGARIADPGEFTKRAFLSGKIDLTQAEAVMDLISAKTEKSARLAVEQLEGRLSKHIRQVRKELLAVLSQIEAIIDFPDDVSSIDTDLTASIINAQKEKLGELLKNATGGHILRDGISVAVVGLPNVGKSSLLNLLLGADRAIVSAIPGTTRDTIEESLNLDGIPLKIIDTAGIREIVNEVEAEGIKRSLKTIIDAQMIIFMFDTTNAFSEKEVELLKSLKEQNKPFLLVGNKIDLLQGPYRPEAFFEETTVYISVKKQLGVEELSTALKELLNKFADTDPETDLILSNPRHIEKILIAREALEKVIETISLKVTIDFWTIDLREAVLALGEITGEDITEEILDNIFSSFCIGK